MKNRLFWCIAAGLVLFMGTSSLVSAKSDSTGNGGFTEADKEFYLESDYIDFIMPGVEFELMDFEIPDDLQPLATFKVTSAVGRPLDIDGVETLGEVDIRFMLLYFPPGEEQPVSYHARSRDRDGVYTDLGDGMYTYKFDTVLEGYDEDNSHQLGVVTTRDLRDFDLDRYYDNDVYPFVPSGTGEAFSRDIVTTATCNRCHDPLGMHGGRYQEVQICQSCHNVARMGDDDGFSYSLHSMIHRVHSGNEPEIGEIHYPVLPSDSWNDCAVCHNGSAPSDDFPLVADPNPAPVCDGSGRSITEIIWGDEGNVEVRIGADDGTLFAASGTDGDAETGKWVTDGMMFYLVNAGSGEELGDVTVNNSVFGCAHEAPGTFRGESGALNTRWKTNPSRAACGGCHIDIDFAAGEGHPAQSNDDSCGLCHQPTGAEFGASITGAHTALYKSQQLDGFYVDILDIEDTDPGDSPRVTFKMYDKFGMVMPSEVNRLRFSINGPNDDYTFYVQEDVLGRAIAQDDGSYTFRFAAKLPNFGSATLGLEGRLEVEIDVGEDEPEEVEDQMQNYTVPFAVTDSTAMARRVVVDDALCENCHSHLSLHGENRNNGTEYCQTCHRPDATDAAVRPAGTGPAQSIDFRTMIHKIHRGADLVYGYTVYGYRSSFNDFSDVEFPGDLRNCESCHVDDSYLLPLDAGLVPVTTPQGFMNPTFPETAACVSCHDGSGASAHAMTNTTDFGEACSACHGEGSTYDVEKVHAR